MGNRAVWQLVVVAIGERVLACGKGCHVGQSLKMLVNDFSYLNLTCLARTLSTEAAIFSVMQAVSR